MPTSTSEPKVVVTKNGPYLVTGSIPLSRQTIVTDENGDPKEWRQDETFPPQETYYLCRCGHSAHKPFCDGTHKKIGFDGTEKASHEPYRNQAKKYAGPSSELADAEALCSGADFCQANGTVWKQVTATSDAAVRKSFIGQVGRCPSGRLVALERTSGAAVEPTLPKSIGVIEEPTQKVSGPLWVRGGIPVIAADGFAFEVRNRATLCRCGASGNKPFCDGSHYKIGFTDRQPTPP